MKVVVDTNVLVSGLLSPDGPPGKIVGMIGGGELEVCHDPRTLAEYREVLARPEFDISDLLITDLLDQIRAIGEPVNALPLAQSLSDSSDEAFLEVAVSGGVDCLITGNLKHFPAAYRQGMRVLSPREFLEFYRDRQAGGSGTVKSPAARYRSTKRRKNG